MGLADLQHHLTGVSALLRPPFPPPSVSQPVARPLGARPGKAAFNSMFPVSPASPVTECHRHRASCAGQDTTTAIRRSLAGGQTSAGSEPIGRPLIVT